MLLCKLCLNLYPSLVEAHIIPQAFFAFGEGGAERSKTKILTSKDNTHPRRTPKGIYDEEILCFKCENEIFMPWDDKAIKFFQNDLKDNYPYDSKFKIYSPSQFDYEYLRLFFLSVLWRAHHSKQDFYEKVSLGDHHEGALKTILLKQKPDDYLQYPIFVRRYNTNRLGARVILHPIFAKQFFLIERNFYVINMAAHQIIIKVDKRNWPSDLDEFILKPDAPLYVGLIDFEKSNSYEAIMDVLEKNKNVKFR